MSKTWKKQGQNNVIVAQALEALSKDKNLSRQQKMTLRDQCNNTVQAKQTMAAMGWEFDPTKNRKEQVQGTYFKFQSKPLTFLTIDFSELLLVTYLKSVS